MESYLVLPESFIQIGERRICPNQGDDGSGKQENSTEALDFYKILKRTKKVDFLHLDGSGIFSF